MKLTVELDSSERDPILYPNPNNYTLKLNRPIYDVSNMTITGGIVPKTQNLINTGNKQFTITTSPGALVSNIILQEGTWSNGAALASNLTQQLTTFDGLNNTITATFNTDTNKMTYVCGNLFSFNFYSGSNGFSSNTATVGTPAQIMGFPYVDTTPSNTLEGNIIDLNGPASVIIVVSGGSEKFCSELYTQTQYTGRILLGTFPIGSMVSIGSDSDIPVVHRFHRGPEKFIDELHVEFFYKEGNKLVKYDFGFRNHIIKFEFECAVDKLVSQERMDKMDTITQLPPPVDYIYDSNDTRFNLKQKTIMIIVFIFLIIGLMALSGQSSIPEHSA